MIMESFSSEDEMIDAIENDRMTGPQAAEIGCFIHGAGEYMGRKLGIKVCGNCSNKQRKGHYMH